LKKLEKLRQPSRGKSSKIVELPSLGSLDERITTAYLCKNRSNNLHMSQPSQFTNNAWNEKGGQIPTPKNKGGVYRQKPTIMMQVVWGSRALMTQ
jgi:hypothetical protein